jgi:hypothetical protein
MRRWRTYVSKSFKPSAESLRCRQQCTSGCHKHNKFLGREPEGFGKLECWAKLQILRIYPGTSSVTTNAKSIDRGGMADFELPAKFGVRLIVSIPCSSCIVYIALTTSSSLPHPVM